LKLELEEPFHEAMQIRLDQSEVVIERGPKNLPEFPA
jgi:hypothetical protein